MTLSTVSTVRSSTDIAAVEQLAHQAATYASGAMSANTARAYRSDFADFQAWCDQLGVSALPAAASTVALYLTARASSLTVATLGRRLAAIRTAHTLANLDVPAGGELKATWAGIRRAHGRPGAPKAALVMGDVREVIAATPDTLQGLRDRALLLIGFGGALRRSELASLELDARGAGPVRVRFVDGGLEIHIDRSKGDQLGRGAVVAVPYGRNPDSCPVRALQAWLAAAGISAGPVFRAVNRWGHVSDRAITDQVVALVVKAAAARAGLDATVFAGHSLRSGCATSAAANGATAERLMGHLRHAKYETSAKYVRQVNRFANNVAAAAGI
jgi:site-specific recombinase XerD